MPDSRRTRSSPELRLGDEMIDRAAKVFDDHREHVCDGREIARLALEAAFEGVPLSNFSIGLLLQAFDRVIVTREGAGDIAAMAFVANGPDGFDGVEHTMRTQLKAGGPRGMFVRTLSFTFEPPEVRNAV